MVELNRQPFRTRVALALRWCSQFSFATLVAAFTKTLAPWARANNKSVQWCEHLLSKVTTCFVLWVPFVRCLFEVGFDWYGNIILPTKVLSWNIVQVSFLNVSSWCTTKATIGFKYLHYWSNSVLFKSNIIEDAMQRRHCRPLICFARRFMIRFGMCRSQVYA